MITPALSRIRAAVLEHFAAEFASGELISGGIYNRRKMRRFDLWSQHAWGNAWDLKVSPAARAPGGAGDRVNAWLVTENDRGRLPVERIIWRSTNHYDHLHIVGDPRQTGTPPLSSTQEDPDMEQLKAIVTGIQQSLILAGYELPKFGADGVWGPETASAFDRMVADAALSVEPGGDHGHPLEITVGGPIPLEEA